MDCVDIAIQDALKCQKELNDVWQKYKSQKHFENLYLIVSDYQKIEVKGAFNIENVKDLQPSDNQ